MKSIGIVKKLDELGRLVLPKELRQNLNIEESDVLKIFTENDVIVIKKYEPCCIFCGSIELLQVYHDRHVCSDCIKVLIEAIKN